MFVGMKAVSTYSYIPDTKKGSSRSARLKLSIRLFLHPGRQDCVPVEDLAMLKSAAHTGLAKEADNPLRKRATRASSWRAGGVERLIYLEQVSFLMLPGKLSLNPLYAQQAHLSTDLWVVQQCGNFLSEIVFTVSTRI